MFRVDTTVSLVGRLFRDWDINYTLTFILKVTDIPHNKVSSLDLYSWEQPSKITHKSWLGQTTKLNTL